MGISLCLGLAQVAKSIIGKLVQPLVLGDSLCVKVLFNKIPFKAHTDASVLHCCFHCKHRILTGHLPWECRTVASEDKQQNECRERDKKYIALKIMLP